MAPFSTIFTQVVHSLFTVSAPGTNKM